MGYMLGKGLMLLEHAGPLFERFILSSPKLLQA